MPPRKKKEPKTTQAPQEPAPVEIIQVEPVPEEPCNSLVSQSDLAAIQQGYTILDNEVQRLGQENLGMAKALKKMKEEHFPDPQPWYASWGVWLAVILTLATLYLAFAFYLSETGHRVIIPPWFLGWLDSVIPH